MFLKQSFRGKNNFSLYLLSTLIIIIASQIIGAIPLLVVTFIKAAKGGTINPKVFSDLSGLEINQNVSLLLMLIPFVIGFFAIWLCVTKIHKKKFLDVISTRPKFDISRMLKGAGLWSILLLISMIPIFFGDTSNLEFNFQPTQFIILFIICLLILPLQTSFEEILFRGYYMQALAVTTKSRWFPLIITSIIFGLLHSMNPEVQEFGFWLSMPNYILMGLILGIVTVMDNGLEIALGVHFANNFLSATLFTTKVSVLRTPALFIDNDPSMSIWDSVTTLIAGFIFVYACSKIFKWQDWGKLFRKINIE